jgi:Kef-type K+ transport system membrane component KefB
MPVIFAASVEHGSILLALLLIILSAKLLAELFERLRQPAVVGEILAGVLIGPSVLNWVQPSDFISIIAELGVIFLLFTVGLETKPEDILRVGRRAFTVAVLGVIIPFIAGYLIAIYWDGSFIEAMFIGSALVATSVGITARVLDSLGLLDRETSRVILGAAVIDDVLGLIILSVVSALGKGGLSYTEILKTAGLAIAFTVIVGFFGSKIIRKLKPVTDSLHINKPYFNIGLIFCLGLSVLSIYFGVAAIIGAFLAGMALAETTADNHKMHQMTAGVTEFLVPFFLVNIGMQLNLSVYSDYSVILLSVLVTVAAVLSKFVGGGLGAWGMRPREMAQIGSGMVPRGEVGIVVAQIGLGLAAVSEQFFAAVLTMAVATTLIAPPLIKFFYTEDTDRDGLVEELIERDISEDYSRIG